ncbi:hypothetical protein BH09BAC1_BH09BAC1_04800 [soil metagenome]
MNIKDINNSKVPIVRIDEALDKHKDTVFFPKKVAEANKTLAAVGLPKHAKQKRA